VGSPLQVDIIVHAPTVFLHCRHCELVWRQVGFGRGVRADQLRSGLPEDMLREYAQVSEWAGRLLATHGERIAVRVIDATSLAGLWRSLRYRLGRLPAIVVGRREKFSGADVGAADALIARCLSSP
jgi:hypothetical protein